MWTKLWPVLKAILETLRRHWAAKGIEAGRAQASAEDELRVLREEQSERDARQRTLAASILANQRKLSTINQRIKEWHESHHSLPQ